jgi:hypothetical protein
VLCYPCIFLYSCVSISSRCCWIILLPSIFL